MERGTRLTLQWAEEYGKPYFHLDLQDFTEPEGDSLSRAGAWLSSGDIHVLNVAGNRESTSPGIGELTIRVLERLFGSAETT